MVAHSVIAGIVALIIVIVLIIAAVLGLGLLPKPASPASNVTSNATTNATITSTATATVTPSGVPTTAPPAPSPSGQQITVTRGQTFTISLSANPSTGYQWKPTFDTGALSLSGQTFVSNATSTRLVGAGGTDLFTFQALRVGTTNITFDNVSPGGQTTQSTSYTVNVR